MSWDLISDRDGSILGAPVEYGSYAGSLMAGDVYTLRFSLHAEADQPDPSGSYASIWKEIDFTIVPEPSPTLLLLGMALTAFVWRQRTRA